LTTNFYWLTHLVVAVTFVRLIGFSVELIFYTRINCSGKTCLQQALTCEEHLVTNLLKWPWSLSLCQCVLLEKKSSTKSLMTPHFFTRNRWWLSSGPYFQESHTPSSSLKFSSDFLLSTKCKAIFAVASFRNSSAHFLSLRAVLALVGCPIVLSIYSPILRIAW